MQFNDSKVAQYCILEDCESAQSKFKLKIANKNIFFKIVRFLNSIFYNIIYMNILLINN
jgi:hypothetical protein